MTIESDGLLYRNTLKIGLDELQWLQEENHERRRVRLRGMMAEAGFLAYRTAGGDLDYTWRVIDADSDGVLEIELDAQFQLYGADGVPSVAVAIDAAGDVLELSAEEDISGITVPDDGVWRTLVVRKDTSQYEPGTIQVTAGSPNIVGIGTKFTRLAAFTTSGFDRGSNVRIDAGDTSGGNAGTYELDTITSDTVAALRTNIAGANESGLLFTIAGDYSGAAPADPDIHQRPILEWELVARTVTPANDDLVIADVMLDTGASAQVQVIDRRHMNLYRPLARTRAQHHGYMPKPMLDFTAAGGTVSTVKATARTAAAADTVNMSLCQSRENTVLAVFEEAGKIYARHYLTVPDPVGPGWSNPGGAGAITVDGGGGATHPFIIQVPRETGNTHLCVYVKIDKLYGRFTTDDGATWAGEVLLWDPLVVDVLDKLTEPCLLLTRAGRIIVVVAYYDDSDGAKYQARWAFSDDYGTTWDTDTSVGYLAKKIGAAPPTSDVRSPYIAQDESGIIWLAYEKNPGTSATIHLTFANNGGIRLDVAAGIPSFSTDPEVGLDPLGGTNAMWNPKLWVGPDGTVCVFYENVKSSGGQDIRVSVCGTYKNPSDPDDVLIGIMHNELVVSMGTAATLDKPYPAIYQARSGILHMLAVDTAGTPSDALWFPLTPTPMPVTRGWRE